MTVLSSKYLTLLDITKRLDPNGAPAKIAEVLNQENPIVQDMVWTEGNLPTGEQVTIRTGLPDVYFRKLNQGVPNSKSTTAQVTEAAAIIEAYSAVDLDVLAIQNNPDAYREGEAVAFMESMGQKFGTSVFYGDATANPEQFNGLSMRYSSLSAGNGANIIDAGGAATLTSLWLIGHGANGFYGFYPKGSKAGLQHNDLGQKTLFDSNTPPQRYQGVEDQFQWKCGVIVKDWNYVVRVANINTSTLTKNAATGADLMDIVVRAMVRLKNLTGCTPRWYGNRTLESFFLRQAQNKVANSTLRVEDINGQPVAKIGGIPFRRTDALVDTETQVT